MSGRFALARTQRYALRQARVARSLLERPIGAGDGEGLALVDLVIADGKIAAIKPSRENALPDDLPRLPLGGAIALPLFVDAHTHLDKGDLLATGMAPERDLFTAVARVREDLSLIHI